MKKSLIVRIGGRFLYLRNLALTSVFRMFPIRDNQVILWSYYFAKYSCNPRALTEYILEQPEKMKVIWAFQEPEHFVELDPRITKVKWKSVRYLYALCTSRFVVTNARIFTTACFRKRSGQIYIQTWHSSIRLKKIEGDALGALDAYYVKCAKMDSALCDLLISGSGFSTEIYKRAFWYDKEILECGTPRTDALLRLAAAQPEASIRERLGIPQESTILLYAPTFRTDHCTDAFTIDFDKLIRAYEEEKGKKLYVLVRMHPNMLLSGYELLRCGQNVVDVTAYDDINELLLIADYLVTDYSSCLFDFLLLQKPCFIYAPDLAEYDRGMYFDLRKPPFLFSDHAEQLFANILGWDEGNEREISRFLQEELRSFETGHACEAIYKWMLTHRKGIGAAGS